MGKAVEIVTIEDVLAENERVSKGLLQKFQEAYGDKEGEEIFESFSEMQKAGLELVFENHVRYDEELGGIEVTKETLVSMITAFLGIAVNNMVQEKVDED